MLLKLKKFFRFKSIYGFDRALIKSLGRLRLNFNLSFLVLPTSIFKKRRVAIIGCGQFAFTTIAYFVNKYSPYKIFIVYDLNKTNAETLAKFYGCKIAYRVEDVFSSNIDLVYIASNHASHSHYAIMAMKKGVDVYIEKPISVSTDQLNDLEKTRQINNVNLYCGYNRPFSPAIRKVKNEINNKLPLNVSIYVIGHFIEDDHWYRDPEEGTRICGNLGHWIDLSIHLIYETPISEVKITIIYSDESMPDDNLLVVLKTSRGDIFSITLTSYSEPFEGISETINIHQRDYQVLIDDFRTACFQKNYHKEEIKYRPKDVGHKNAILQPFQKNPLRSFNEVIVSTKLMLHIKDMVQNKTIRGNFRW